jgi:long-chain acyl-CoA synthetase
MAIDETRDPFMGRTSEEDGIARAHLMGGPSITFPWQSFGDFVASQVHDSHLADRLCLSYHDDDRSIHRRYSYRQFGDLIERAAAFMSEGLGLRRGDRVATVLFNHDQTVLTYFAAWSLGLAVVPINIEESTEKQRYILEHSEAIAVFCWEDCLAEVQTLSRGLQHLRHLVVVGEPGTKRSHTTRRLLMDELASMKGPGMGRWHEAQDSLGDEAVIVYTSGTTGPPKGVVLTAENLLVDADGITAWHGFRRDDRLGCVLPIHHVNGMVVTLVTPFYFGGAAVLNRKFRSATFWSRIHNEQIKSVSVVPTLLEFLLDADEDLSGYQLEQFSGVICGAGPLLKETAGRFEDRFGFPIRHGYGLSETTCYSCFLPNELSTSEHRRWLTEYDFPSIGLPIPHNEMAILDDRGRPLPAGTRGEICIRGQTVCAGYFKRPDANDAAFRWGWFRSGDEGFWEPDESGRPFFFISGRLKELIIRGGVNISPLEIDDVLKGHPSVKFAMAVPFENRYYGEEVAAYIVPRDDVRPPTDADLRAYCRERLSFAKRPKIFLFGTDVPYTTTGKPKRLELKARLAPSLAAYRETQFKDS